MSDTTMQPRYKCTRLITLQKKPSSFMFLGKVIHLDQDNYVSNTMTAELLDILEASPHIFIKTAAAAMPATEAPVAVMVAAKEAVQELDVASTSKEAEPIDSVVDSDVADLDIPEYSAEPVTKQRRKRVQSQK